MARKKDPLQELPPEPVVDERSPLLANGSGNDNDQETLLTHQAEQERREYESGTVPLASEPTFQTLLATMSSLWVTTFFAALDTSVVATLSGPISSSFESGTSFSWIASGYLIANAACQPLSGKLTDIYGRRAGLVFAVTFFAAGTLTCGLAPTAGWMIAGRVIAGAGGGCINTVSVFIASDLIPLRRRGVWQGITNIVFGTGMALGGVYGGLINDRIGWRYCFYFQTPFIVAAGIISIIRVKVPLKKSDTAKIRRVDFLGALTLVAALVLLLLGLNSGGNIVPWNHPLVYVPIPISLVLFLVFIYIEDRVAPEPVIPVRLLAHQSVLAALLTNWFMTMSVFGLIYYGPVFFQVVRGVSATEAGTLFIPQAFGMASGSLVSGLFMRWTGKYYWWHVALQGLSVTASALILGFFRQGVPLALPFLFLLLGGFAYGSMLTVTLLALISAVDHKYQAVITSASYAFRSTGSTIGITIASAVFQNLLKKLLYERFGDLPDAADRIRRIRDSADIIRDLPASWKAGVIEAYVGALQGVWVVVLGFAIATAIVSVFIKQHKLYSSLDRK
ncbi:Multidrug resistance fnx1 [Lecanosticta acicola]|uniref:Multidrug resistance fnx1 n=1 Tax=Lecanosticta acicola TaxID=111012 RepID=A0AAI8Z550_9PEZI|nr:Multidrug resistance fnx1 [Lecanosticta acicola]